MRFTALLHSPRFSLPCAPCRSLKMPFDKPQAGFKGGAPVAGSAWKSSMAAVANAKLTKLAHYDNEFQQQWRDKLITKLNFLAAPATVEPGEGEDAKPLGYSGFVYEKKSKSEASLRVMKAQALRLLKEAFKLNLEAALSADANWKCAECTRAAGNKKSQNQAHGPFCVQNQKLSGHRAFQKEQVLKVLREAQAAANSHNGSFLPCHDLNVSHLLIQKSLMLTVRSWCFVDTHDADATAAAAFNLPSSFSGTARSNRLRSLSGPLTSCLPCLALASRWL